MPRVASTPDGGFGPEDALEALEEACRIAELDSRGAKLMRLGENALFLLNRTPTVVRIARTMDYWADAQNEVNVARWLRGVKFAASETADFPQPIDGAGHPTTFWKYIEGRPGAREDIATLGAVLRRLHALPRPTTFVLPNEAILGRVDSRIAGASVSAEDKDFLLARLVALRDAVSQLRFPMKPAPTHGDAHSENLMICSDGRPVLIDFERFAWGQPEWDLSMTATEFATAGWWTSEEYAQFTEAYGYDVMDWKDGFPALQAVHEIKMTTCRVVAYDTHGYTEQGRRGKVPSSFTVR